MSFAQGDKEMYKFSVYSFSEDEIDQICELVKRWAIGDSWLPIDARKYTKQVKEYALHWDLLEKRAGRLYLAKSSLFNVLYGLPSEALWRLVQPMLVGGSAGYSIVNSKLWTKHLGIDPQNSRHATEADLKEKEAILLELDSCGYIYVAFAGDTWSIRTRERKVA